MLVLLLALQATDPAIVAPEALAPFFNALASLEEKQASDRVEVVVFGNSLISADNIVNIVRNKLQKQFGDGGRGLLIAERIGDVGSRKRTGTATSGKWVPHNLAMGGPGRGHFGLSGVFHESTRESSTEWVVEGESHAQLFWLDHPAAPVMALFADKERLAVITPEREGTHGRTLAIALPPGTKKVSLRALGSHAVVFGMSFEKEGPGVVLDNFGIPAAEAGKFLSANVETTAQHIKARRPALNVFFLGGNEARRLGWSNLPVKTNKARMQNALEQLITRTRDAHKEAACLVIGPIDAVYRDEAKKESDRLKTHPHVRDIIAIESEAAAATGCAFFDLFEAMGGAGSLAKFKAKGWLHEDLVHPKGRGLDVLGEMIAKALLDAYKRRPNAPLANLR